MILDPPPIDVRSGAPAVPIVDGAIQADIPCLDCDYNLRGLPPDGRCPECGESVAEALAAFNLNGDAAVWAREFGPAAATVATSLRLAGAAFAAGVLAAFLERWNAAFFFTCAMLAVLAGVFSGIGLVFGFCALTCQPRSGLLPPGADRIRVRARRAAAGVPASFALAVAAGIVYLPWVQFGLLLIGICGVVWVHEHVRYIGALAEAWERPQLGSTACAIAALVWVVVAAGVLAGAVAALAESLFGPGEDDSSNPLSSVVPVVLGLVAGAGSILLLALLASLHLRLNRELRALSIWREAPSTLPAPAADTLAAE